MADIICLANSWKHDHRCVAGCDLKSGKWIRPVSGREHGEITFTMRRLGKEEPRLLDVLRIPLEPTGPHYDCQPENRLLKPGAWKRIGTVMPNEVLGLYEDCPYVLHNNADRVSVEDIKALPLAERRSLQLIHVTDFVAKNEENWRGKKKWRAYFTYKKRRIPNGLPITDPVLWDRLDKSGKVGEKSVLAVSMGTPFSGSCFKFLAGYVEL